MLFANGKWMFHLVIFQVNHLLCEGSFCAIYLFQPLYRKDWDIRSVVSAFSEVEITVSLSSISIHMFNI